MIEAVAQTLLPLASWIGFASLKSLMVIPLVLVLRRLCARWLTPQGRYGLWFALLACLAFPFGAEIGIGAAPHGATPAAVVVAPSSTADLVPPTIRIDPAPAAAAATPGMSTASNLVLMWLLGVTILAGVVSRNFLRYRGIASQAAATDSATDELFQRCKQMLGVLRRVRLLETSQVPSPVVVGYWRPTLLLPPALAAQVSSEQLRLVLLHELTHIKRHDILMNWAATVVQIAHWFNPLAWYALRVMRNDMEQACDADVLRRLSASEQTEYGDTLIRLSDLAPPRPLLVQNASVVENRSQLKARIRMIAQFKPYGLISSILGAVLIVVTSAVAVTQAASPPQPSASTAPRPTPPTTIKQAAPAAAATAAQQPAPAARSGRTTGRPVVTAEANPLDATRLPSTPFRVTYANARELAAFIQTAPGIGLLSEKGSIAVDEKTNTFFVQEDDARNIAMIGQIVATLDVPPQTVLISGVFARIDADLFQELAAGKVAGSALPPLAVLGPEQEINAALAAAEQAQRAKVISRPRFIVRNRVQSTVGAAEVPLEDNVAAGIPWNKLALSLSVTPTVAPDSRVKLDVNIIQERIGQVVVTTGGAEVPAIDTAEFRSNAFVDSGSTVMFNVTTERLTSSATGREQRLVAFVTPTIMPDPRSPTR